jgi:hypothetical protein
MIDTRELAIVFTCFERPAYLEQMLTSLLRCEGLITGRARLFARVEPSPRLPDVLALLERLVPTAEVTVNPERLGVRHNPHAALEAAFAHCERVLYLEEDLLVAPDLLSLVDAYFACEQPGDLCLNLLLGGTCSAAFYSDVSLPSALVRARAFNSLGWAATRDKWRRYLSAWWFDDDRRFCTVDDVRASGWDIAVHRRLLAENLRVVAPLLARALHIGRSGGVHCSEADHDRAFAALPLASELAGPFELTELPPSAPARAFLALLDESARALLSLEARRASPLKTWWKER